MEAIIEQHLSTFGEEYRRVEVAFFGGNFTGLPVELQVDYLSAVARFREQGLVQSIRLSTRPDYMTPAILDILFQYGVGAIELGAQSTDPEVLKLSGRGHSADQVEEASELILKGGFDLGLQMMVGLPADTLQKTMKTASRFVELGASQVRIYPTLVIRNTPLANLFKQGKYTPLQLQEAIEICKELVLFFEKNSVKVLRVGLHPSEGLISGAELLAGPFHPAFKELVETAIWADILHGVVLEKEIGKTVEVRVSSKQINAAIGHKAANKKRLIELFKRVKFVGDNKLIGRQYHVGNC